MIFLKVGLWLRFLDRRPRLCISGPFILSFISTSVLTFEGILENGFLSIIHVNDLDVFAEVLFNLLALPHKKLPKFVSAFLPLSPIVVSFGTGIGHSHWIFVFSEDPFGFRSAVLPLALSLKGVVHRNSSAIVPEFFLLSVSHGIFFRFQRTAPQIPLFPLLLYFGMNFKQGLSVSLIFSLLSTLFHLRLISFII